MGLIWSPLDPSKNSGHVQLQLLSRLGSGAHSEVWEATVVTAASSTTTAALQQQILPSNCVSDERSHPAASTLECSSSSPTAEVARQPATIAVKIGCSFEEFVAEAQAGGVAWASDAAVVSDHSSRERFHKGQQRALSAEAAAMQAVTEGHLVVCCYGCGTLEVWQQQSNLCHGDACILSTEAAPPVDSRNGSNSSNSSSTEAAPPTTDSSTSNTSNVSNGSGSCDQEHVRFHGRTCLLLELVPGGSLEQLLEFLVDSSISDAAACADVDDPTASCCDGHSNQAALQPVLPAEEALPLVLDVATALAAVHSIASGAHRDVKSGNVLVWSDQEGRLRGKLADFGCFKHVSEPFAARGGNSLGTEGFTAPELLYPHMFPAAHPCTPQQHHPAQGQEQGQQQQQQKTAGSGTNLLEDLVQPQQQQQQLDGDGMDSLGRLPNTAVTSTSDSSSSSSSSSMQTHSAVHAQHSHLLPADTPSSRVQPASSSEAAAACTASCQKYTYSPLLPAVTPSSPSPTCTASSGQYTYSPLVVDTWSFGCWLLELRYGRPPGWYIPCWQHSRRLQLGAEVGCPDSPYYTLDVGTKELVKACLVVEPQERPVMVQLLEQHPFFVCARATAANM